MAERRMFAKSIVQSDRFLDMPHSAQALYFQLGMQADDDGFIGNPRTVMRQCNATVDDLRILVGKKFAYAFQSGILVITDWLINNQIRADRRRDTIFQTEKSQLLADENKRYRLRIGQPDNMQESSDNQMTTNCPSDGGQPAVTPATQCRVGEDSTVQISKGECSADGSAIHSRLGNEMISEAEYQTLTHTYSKETVDKVIRRIMEKPYHGCLNADTIGNWCSEQGTAVRMEQSSRQNSPENGKYNGLLGSLIQERRDA